MGCSSYTSDYVPIADGRARVVWRDDKLAMDVAAGASPDCEAALQDPSGSAPYGAAHGSSVRMSGGFWVPVYYGPRIVVVRHGVPRAPRVALSRVPASATVGAGAGTVKPSGSGGAGGVGDLKEAIVVTAVLATVALPAIAIGLAAGRPEPEKHTAEVIDQVNAYNDMARTPSSPCPIAQPTVVQAQ